jgi:tetratricopeptide (TPR) repeat protein
MAAYPTLSLCMIARNEESFIAQCIRSVLPIISETILVDTGSTDKTREIAASLGANVLSFTWCDDFAAPRNLSLEHATGDWILVLDADEVISSRDLETIQKLTRNPHTCYELTQRHYSNDARLSGYLPCTGENPEWERHYGGFFESSLCRLFPNHRGISYRGKVHELVEHSVREIPGLTLASSGVRIHHYGHTPEVRQKKNKGALYTPLGTAKLKDSPEHWQAWYELGVEHNNNGKLAESAAALEKSIALNPRYLPTWVNLGYVLMELKQYERAEKILLAALEMDKKNEEAWCNLGVVYLRADIAKNAESCFRNALSLKPSYINARNNLGKSLVRQNRFAEAALHYQKSLDLNPKNVSANLDLGLLYISTTLKKEGLALLQKVQKLPGIPDHVPTLISQAIGEMETTAAAVNALHQENRLSKDEALLPDTKPAGVQSTPAA